MKKPAGLVYGVDDRPPGPVLVIGSLQHVVLISIRLVFPLLVARAAGLPDAVIIDVLGISMIVMGVATIVQALPRGPVGSGYLCPPSFTSAYIAPSLIVAKSGGLAVVAGMTVFAGLIECVISRLLRPLRPYFPPEIAGLVVVVTGVMLGALGTRNVLGVDSPQGMTPLTLSVVAITLVVTIVLNVWGRGIWKVLSPLIGMVAGYACCWLLGVVTVADFALVAQAPAVNVPSLAHGGLSFDWAYAIPFAIAAVASCLRTMGDVTTCQKINDADWTRPQMRTLAGGVLGNGIATTFGGLLGTLGVNTLTSSVGLSSATGLTSRSVAWAIGIIFCVLAFLPKVGAALVVMPAPVLGAVLWFSAAFVLVNGLQIVTSRMFDVRRTLVFGLSFTIALGVDLYPAVFATAPASVAPITGSALVLGTCIALVMNAIFRVGVRRTKTLELVAGEIDPVKVAAFMTAQGAAWGARRDVIERATFNLVQSLETIGDVTGPGSPIVVEASFDEFRVDLRVVYNGKPLELPVERPSPEEIMASDEGERRLAGFMLRRLADRVTTSTRGPRAVIAFQFDH
jgi:NCS2 family nucleobase:cation symporter-2